MSVSQVASQATLVEEDKHMLKGRKLKDILGQMKAALEAIKPEDKRDYQTAKEIVPQLVMKESPMLGFLRTDDYDPIKAARRLTRYWKFRHDFFQDRYLLPMIQTGRGALTVQDVELLRTGWVFPYRVNEDHFWYVADRSKLTEFYIKAKEKGWDASKALDRCTMYMLSVVPTSNVQCQLKGVDLVQVVNSQPIPPPDFRQNFWEVVRTALPIKFANVLVVQNFEAGKEDLLEFVRFKTAKVVEFNSAHTPKQIYGDSVAKTLKGLQDFGVPREFVPASVGGMLRLDEKIAEWIRARVTMEEFHNPVIEKEKFLPASKKGTAEPLIKRKRDERETEEAFCKKRNALYSRRMYHKRKLEILSLEEDVKNWEGRNAKIRKDNERLEQLWHQATQVLVSRGFSSDVECHMRAVQSPKPTPPTGDSSKMLQRRPPSQSTNGVAAGSGPSQNPVLNAQTIEAFLRVSQYQSLDVMNGPNVAEAQALLQNHATNTLDTPATNEFQAVRQNQGSTTPKAVEGFQEWNHEYFSGTPSATWDSGVASTSLTMARKRPAYSGQVEVADIKEKTTPRVTSTHQAATTMNKTEFPPSPAPAHTSVSDSGARYVRPQTDLNPFGSIPKQSEVKTTNGLHQSFASAVEEQRSTENRAGGGVGRKRTVPSVSSVTR